ncbi:MAG TPA: hypothetical protein VF172_11925 [Nitrososphaera sp.]
MQDRDPSAAVVPAVYAVVFAFVRLGQTTMATTTVTSLRPPGDHRYKNTGRYDDTMAAATTALPATSESRGRG